MSMNLVLLLGKTVPRPVPASLNESISAIEINHTLGERSGFQVTFQLNRVGVSEQQDDPIISSDLLAPFSRMIIGMTINATPDVLLDGIITHHEVNYSNTGEMVFTVTGEDVSIMMDLEDKSVLHTAQAEHVIATKLIAAYSRYGLIPQVKPPTTIDSPLPTDRLPSQQETDFAYLHRMADRFGFVFYIQPGPISGSNTAYWGPARSTGSPLPALTVDMGAATNTNSVNVRLDALSATTIQGQIDDRKTNVVNAIQIPKGSRSPLSARTALQLQPQSRITQFRGTGPAESLAKAQAQATIDRSIDRSVILSGSLDTLVYGSVLKVGKLIGVRGMGGTHDGSYVVQQVSHSLSAGNYTQQFTLFRDGIGSLRTVVSI